MSRIQESAEVMEQLLWKELLDMRLTHREQEAVNNVLLHLSVTGEYRVPEHLKVIK
jgi:hypothetical protein